jgi:hypothetical protein
MKKDSQEIKPPLALANGHNGTLKSSTVLLRCISWNVT